MRDVQAMVRVTKLVITMNMVCVLFMAMLLLAKLVSEHCLGMSLL